MTTTHRTLMIVALLAGFVFAPPASAQPSDDSVDDTMSKEGIALYQEARQARRDNDFARCLARARAAWKLYQKNNIAALRGDCASQLGQWIEAATFLEQYFADPSPTADAAFTEHLTARREAALNEVAKVALSASPEGARVLVDGAPLRRDEGVVIEHLFVLPGEHLFRAELAGHVAAEERRTLAAGDSVAVVLALAPVERPPPPEPPPPVAERGGIPLAVPVAVGVVGIAGIALGIAGEVLRGNARSDFDAAAARVGADPAACRQPAAALAADCQALAHAIEDHDRAREMEAAGFVIGGAALVAAAIMLPFSDFGGNGTERDTTLRIAPTIAPERFGIGIGGTW